MKKLLIISFISVALFSLSGCGGSAGSNADMESSQMASKLNAQRNWDAFKQSSGMSESAVFDIDTTISRKHLKGDGYASAQMMLDGKLTGSKVWCGTLRGRGCKLKQPSQDGQFDPKLDHSSPIQK